MLWFAGLLQFLKLGVGCILRCVNLPFLYLQWLAHHLQQNVLLYFNLFDYQRIHRPKKADVINDDDDNDTKTDRLYMYYMPTCDFEIFQ